MRKLFYTLAAVAALILGFLGYCTVLYLQADMRAPDIHIDLQDYSLAMDSDSVRICGDNSLILNRYGLWEARLGGSSSERGAAFGVMAKDLLEHQENVFIGFIRDLIPSDGYLRFLRAFLEIFNRNMAGYVPEDQREEIYAMSQSCSHDFDMIGSPYERQMHYHAAHDIGHMMQQYMLVGCTSFAVKEECSEDGKLLIGRNFDFYVGDAFAQNKVIYFVRPEEGYAYVSISWPGMTGVVSGMNEKGLTLTMNASKGPVPTSSAMPVALMAKKILMQAQTISEAYNIALESELFVSESLLIGSAVDGRAAIIEKTPSDIALYEAPGDMLVCSNHFQSSHFADDEYNRENLERSDSRYRHQRMTELLTSAGPIGPADAVSILRDRAGLGGEDIGLFNEKAMNQSIAHHAVVFRPEDLQLWVSTSPWQSGAFLCYDLKSVFSIEGAVTESLYNEDMTIAADSLFLSEIYPRILEYRNDAASLERAIEEGHSVSGDFLQRFVDNNPEFYQSYELTGDYHASQKNYELAVRSWKTALSKEIPQKDKIEELEKKISKHDKK